MAKSLNDLEYEYFAAATGYDPATDTSTGLSDAVESVVSTANSTTVNLANGAVFTGTSEEVRNYSQIQVSVFSSHASATNGLSLQQSSDGTNWDIVDTYTIPAATGKIFSLAPAARYFRLVYTNGGTLTTSLRIQVVYKRYSGKASSQRPQDARDNENDMEEVVAYQSVFNGTTWDRQRGDITNGLDVDVTRIIPGVTATALGKAEDAVHASGDTGVFTLGVANANAATAFAAAGDYTPFAVDVNGVQYMQSRPWSRARLTADGQIKASAGLLHQIIISPTQATPVAGLLTIYDNTAESGTVLWSGWFKATDDNQTIILDVLAATGIYCGFDGTLTGIAVVATYL